MNIFLFSNLHPFTFDIKSFKVQEIQQFNMTIFHTSVIARYFFRCAFTNKLNWPVKRTGYSIWKKSVRAHLKVFYLTYYIPVSIHPRYGQFKAFVVYLFFFKHLRLCTKGQADPLSEQFHLGCWDPSGACA